MLPTLCNICYAAALGYHAPAVRGTSLAALLVALSAACSFAYLEVQRDWWCDDDPALFAFGLRVDDPLSFFHDKELLGYGRLNRNTLTPFQMVSFWIDGRLAPREAGLAYLHSALALAATAVALMALVARLSGPGWAFGCAATWLFLPSTQAVHEFLSTRHYMEGLLACLIALALGHRVARGDGGVAAWMGALAFAAVAALCKETYAFAALFGLAALFLFQKRRGPLLSVLLLGALYGAYRLWAHGLRASYGMPLLWPIPFVGVVLRFPYMLAANHGGYLLALGIAALTIFRATRAWSRGAVVAVIGLLAGSVLVVYPVAIALQATWHEPGTWYRATFALNTIGWTLGWVALSRVRDVRVHALAALLTVAALVPGSLRTRAYWDDYKRSYEIEGRFFLEHPSRLVYSVVPASWYLGGLSRLYDARQPHVTWRDAQGGRLDRGVLAAHPTLWRRDGERMIEDPALFRKLLEDGRR